MITNLWLLSLSQFANTVKDQFVDKYITHFTPLSGFTLSTVILGFIYIHLMARESRYAWLIAAYNCAVLTYVWSDKHIIGQAGLYAFYIVNALYAFIFWSNTKFSVGELIKSYLLKLEQNAKIFGFIVKPIIGLVNLLERVSKKEVHGDTAEVTIKFFKPSTTLLHLVIVGAISATLILIVDYFKTHYHLVSKNTTVDFLLLCLSLYALLIQVRKYTESWFYFTIIDYTVFIMYIKLHLFLLALVRGYIATISAYGFVKWALKYQRLKREKNTNNAPEIA